jgi:hypothetical protein
MAKTTEDYMEMGRSHARNQGPGAPTPYPRNSTSWQAQAYWAGFDAIKPKTPLAIRVEAEQVHWPQAVREHVRLLSTAFANDPHSPRAPRWGRSINRMYTRYGRAPRFHDVAISTQPHPDGPITIGQLLKGQ